MNQSTHKSSRRRCGTTHKARSTAGFAMVEVLVAVLLFTIGILGLVGLQATMTQTQTDGKVRADAANLVDELSTLMWADLGKPTTPGGAFSMTSLAGYTAGTCGSNAHCAAWQDKVGKVLPNGKLDSLTFDATESTTEDTHGLATVTLKWTLPSSDVEHKYVATFSVTPTGF